MFRKDQNSVETAGVSNYTSLLSSNKIILGLVCGHIALLVLFVFMRFVDGDEGFYLSAAQQVAQGKLPYHDFFFPQMPYLPSVLSFVAGHGFTTFYLARLLGIIPAILTLLLFVRIVNSLTEDRRIAVLATGMYAFSGMVLAWHSPAKTYVWTDLCLLVAFWGVVKLGESKQQCWLVVSAIALALAINFRLVLLATLVPYGYYLWRMRKSIQRVLIIVAFLAALSISIPTLYLCFLSPEHFIFNNLGFHMMRDPSLTFWLSIWQRIATLAKLAVNPQILIVAILFVLTFVNLRQGGSFWGNVRTYAMTPPGIAALFGLTLALAYLTPSPILQQYFVQAFPFVIIASIPTLNRLVSGNRVLARWSNATVVRVVSIVYVLGLIPYGVIHLGAVRDGDSPYRQGNIKNLCAFVMDYPVSGPVLSEWAGVPTLSGRESIVDLEFIGFDYPLPIGDSMKRRFHLPVNGDLRQALSERQPALCVVWNAPDPALQAVADSNYVVVQTFDKFVVYARRNR